MVSKKNLHKKRNPFILKFCWILIDGKKITIERFQSNKNKLLIVIFQYSYTDTLFFFKGYLNDKKIIIIS